MSALAPNGSGRSQAAKRILLYFDLKTISYMRSKFCQYSRAGKDPCLGCLKPLQWGNDQN
jgi:hypothetical protein